jgi:hypothetical protein
VKLLTGVRSEKPATQQLALKGPETDANSPWSDVFATETAWQLSQRRPGVHP